MKADDPRFFEKLDKMWSRDPIEEPVSIDETVFKEIIKLQEEQDNDGKRNRKKTGADPENYARKCVV